MILYSKHKQKVELNNFGKTVGGVAMATCSVLSSNAKTLKAKILCWTVFTLSFSGASAEETTYDHENIASNVRLSGVYDDIDEQI